VQPTGTKGGKGNPTGEKKKRMGSASQTNLSRGGTVPSTAGGTDRPEVLSRTGEIRGKKEKGKKKWGLNSQKRKKRRHRR